METLPVRDGVLQVMEQLLLLLLFFFKCKFTRDG